MEKKIATSMEVLIKVAQYESIRMTKYSEVNIEYSSDEERIKKEDALTAQVTDDMVRSINSLPQKFSKATEDAMDEFADKTAKVIPEWLENGPEPNIADPNGAKKAHEKAEAEIHAKEEDKKETTQSTITEMEELFGPDPEPEAPKSEDKNEDVSEESSLSVEETSDDESEEAEEKSEDVVEDNFDDDEDLFA